MHSLQLFCELLTQWRTDSNGTRVGLDYTAVRAHIELNVDDPERRKALYRDLRHMEPPAVTEYINAAKEAFDEIKRKSETSRPTPD